MGTNIGRGDNVMREMARETNLLEHDRKTGAETPVSPANKKAGMIACCGLVALIVVIVLLFVVL